MGKFVQKPLKQNCYYQHNYQNLRKTTAEQVELQQLDQLETKSDNSRKLILQLNNYLEQIAYRKHYKLSSPTLRKDNTFERAEQLISDIIEQVEIEWCTLLEALEDVTDTKNDFLLCKNRVVTHMNTIDKTEEDFQILLNYLHKKLKAEKALQAQAEQGIQTSLSITRFKFLEDKLLFVREEQINSIKNFSESLKQTFDSTQSTAPSYDELFIEELNDSTTFSETQKSTLSTKGVDQQRSRTLQEEQLETTFSNKGSTHSSICRPPGTPVKHSVEEKPHRHEIIDWSFDLHLLFDSTLVIPLDSGSFSSQIVHYGAIINVTSNASTSGKLDLLFTRRNASIWQRTTPSPPHKLCRPVGSYLLLLVYVTLLHGAKSLITPTGRPPEEKEQLSLITGKSEGIQQQMIKGKIVSNW